MIEIVTQDRRTTPKSALIASSSLSRRVLWPVGGIISSAVGAGRSGGRAGADARVPGEVRYAGRSSRASRYTFRTCLPSAPMVAAPVLQYAQEQGFTKVGAIVADYLGTGVQGAMEGAFEGSGIDYTIEVAPVPPDTDFTPFVRAMSDLRAEMIVATGHPPGKLGNRDAVCRPGWERSGHRRLDSAGSGGWRAAGSCHRAL